MKRTARGRRLVRATQVSRRPLPKGVRVALLCLRIKGTKLVSKWWSAFSDTPMHDCLDREHRRLQRLKTVTVDALLRRNALRKVRRLANGAQVYTLSARGRELAEQARKEYRAAVEASPVVIRR